MNFKEIKELIEILDKSTLTEINIEDTKGKVTLKKEKETEIITPQISQMPVEAAAMPMPQVQSTDSNKTEAPEQLQIITKQLMHLCRYILQIAISRRRSICASWDTVSNETTVCILEAMKLFNEIQAEISGEIVEILVEDGQMVEYGQPLFKVK